ncbi:MAG: Nramp family divalent metal transporter [Phycisphaerales bacterium]|nr:Nramp family divalent metal transporter [Phycisphaerales bacterium]
MDQATDEPHAVRPTIAARSTALSRLRLRIAGIVPFLGPAFIAGVAYMDPGNFATNIEAGSGYGYTLLWVVLMSNLMAMLIQTLSAKLGIATGRNLAELCREQFPRPVTFSLWVLMELAAMATDLAEFIGAALGLRLLFGMSMWLAAIVAAVATFLILGIERFGFRRLELVIAAMVGAVTGCYVIETILDRPSLPEVLHGTFVPQIPDAQAALLACGILGATVMPHAIFLHSSLMQSRLATRDPHKLRRLFRFEQIDIFVAMTIAGLVNAAMLVMAAATFHASGHGDIASIEQAHETLRPLLGSAASVVFAISLLASGLSSTVVGTMAGQTIMQGFIHRRIPIWVRRLVTLAPSFVVILVGADPTRSLVISQVVLSFALPFAILPLILFTRRRDLMGDLVNRRATTAAAVVVGTVIIGLNVFLLWQLLVGG